MYPKCPYCTATIDNIPRLEAKDGTVVHFCPRCSKIISVETVTKESAAVWNAALTSVWDDSIRLTTKCLFDPESKRIVAQEEVELDGVDALTEQYVTYRDEEFPVVPE